ncbi:hypothetical protein MY11210_007776 [Beauveria gryllotalpidicola]
MKLTTTIVMLGLAVANVVASPVIRETSNAETSNAETNDVQTGGLETKDEMTASKGPCPNGKPKLSEDRINFFSLFHTLEMAKLLQGRVKEDEPRNLWKFDIKDARPLHLLIAMKFGKVFEECKGSGASGLDVPPLLNREASLESTPSFVAITGLSEEIVGNLPKEG